MTEERTIYTFKGSSRELSQFETYPGRELMNMWQLEVGKTYLRTNTIYLCIIIDKIVRRNEITIRYIHKPRRACYDQK